MARGSTPLYAHVRGLAVTLPFIIHLLLADVALSALLPVSALFPSLTYHVSSAIAWSVWRGIQFVFTGLNGAEITTSGANLPPGESAIVVANHLGWTDFYMIQQLAVKAGMLGRCRYFAKAQLKNVPFLGWGLWAMGMPLITRNWVQDKKEIDNVFGKLVTYKLPVWLISYSEATRWTVAKYAETVQWCTANNKPIPKHTLYPRTKGFIATVSELRETPHVKAVYDVTIAYAKGDRFLGVPTMWETLALPRLNNRYRFHAHVERYPLEELPHDEEKLALWLEQRWMEKSETLDRLKQLLEDGKSW